MTPINWRLTGEEAAYIANDCDAKVFIADARFRAAAEHVAANAPRARLRVAIGGAIPGFESYEALLRGRDGSDIPDPQLGNRDALHVRHDRQAEGRVSLVRSADLCPAWSPAPIIGRARASIWSPVRCITPRRCRYRWRIPQLFGAAVVLMDGWDCERALELIERHRVTHTHMVPTMMHRLLSLPEAVRKRHDLSSLKYVLHGAAPCPATVKRAMIEWLGPIVLRVLRRDRRHRHARRLARRGSRGPAPSAGPTRPITSGSSTKPAQPLPPLQAGLIYMKAPATGRFNYYKDDVEDRPRLSRRLLHARRRRLSRRRRLPVSDRPQRAPHHLGRREHLSRGGRRRPVRASGDRRRRRDRRARRRVGRGSESGRDPAVRATRRRRSSPRS